MVLLDFCVGSVLTGTPTQSPIKNVAKVTAMAMAISLARLCQDMSMWKSSIITCDKNDDKMTALGLNINLANLSKKNRPFSKLIPAKKKRKGEMTARLLLLGVLYVVVEARSVEKVDVAPGKHCRLCLSSAFLTSCSTCVVGFLWNIILLTVVIIANSQPGLQTTSIKCTLVKARSFFFPAAFAMTVK